MVQRTGFKNIENSRNDQPLKMEEIFNKDTSLWSYLSLEALKSEFNPVKLFRFRSRRNSPSKFDIDPYSDPEYPV